MKLLSIAIPSYNSQAYMGKCIESLLVGGEDVEIIVVNDGSKDDTAKIADSYAEKYPTIVKAVHKENGGHGSAVNEGLKHATGKYYKVVDSDDWVDADAYGKLLDKLREYSDDDNMLDVLISNYVYEKEGENPRPMRLKRELPEDRIFSWDETKAFQKGHYILMHSVIFRTELLRECNLELPKHTFYVDNLYVFEPLPYVKRMYYMNVDFYRYYIGREDQSVNEKVMIGRIDQQIRVNKRMFTYLSENQEKIYQNVKLRKYMLSYLDIITTISCVMMILSGTDENLEKRKELLNYMKETDLYLYKKIRYGLLGIAINLPGKFGRKIAVWGYRIAQKIFHFN